jgi:hypothetical protein
MKRKHRPILLAAVIAVAGYAVVRRSKARKPNLGVI